jgi:hypothetical protein
MNYSVCPRCHSKFYAALTETDVNCPFCGYLNTGSERRGRKRAQISRSCDVLLGGVKISAMTIDVSANGLALELKEEIELAVNDTLEVRVHDFDIDTESNVVWVRKGEGAYTSFGVNFIE